MIPFANGEPVAAANNNSAAIDIFTNADNSVCPKHCFRPVGLAFDSQGRLFVSSDASGEIYVIAKETSSSGSGTTATTSPSSTGVPESDAIRHTPLSGTFSLVLLTVYFFF